MDEDDSQDELINRSTSNCKGKRAALWAISDDSEDVESDEGESDSGQEEVNGDDDEEEEEEEEEEEGNEEDDDEEEEDDVKAEEGACGGTSADLAGMSSDEDTDKCPICLNSFNSQPVATPENCEHYFCFDCILEWAKNANSCPVDRLAFNSIYLRKCYGGKVKKIITVQKPVKEGQEETVDLDLEQTNCEVCGSSDREDRLLLCDGCDAGYHMECLTPPLHSVPVEEWFCPECEPNSRQSRGSAEEVSDTDSLPSTARSATSRSQPRAAGPTRAIARTQQSERVRANVNRHRITQARTSQLAPTYMIQSTWLDETINAVVAGLNTAVYIRDFTPRIPTSRRRKTGRRRKVKRKRTFSVKGKNVGSTGLKRKKRKVRKTKSRNKLMLKKVATPRSRIANNLGIVKDKKSSSLPAVYRPTEHTLSNMRADIGAASLSIYGDPFDLDPFVDREDDEQQAHVTSLLEAKRRGISQSALRSHQPVARPVTAGLSRRGMDVPHAGGVVEAAPIPDLLGSILSGQSILLMDSSDVVINRDGSLKATKPMTPSGLMEGSNQSRISGDGSSLNSPGMSPSPADGSLSFHCNGDLGGSSDKTTNRLLNQSSSHLSPFLASSASHSRLSPQSDLPLREHPSLLSSRPNRPNLSLGLQGATGIGVSKDTVSSSVHHTPDFSSKRKGLASSQSQPKKASTKPMWVDVSVLPRIPKIKRDVTNDYISQCGSSGSNRNSSNGKGSSNSYSLPNIGVNSLSGGKERQQSVDQQKGQADGQAQRHRPERAGSSAALSTSFASSSGSHASQPQCSSSSSAVSFRISSSGNSWHSRRLSIASSSVSGGSIQERWREKEDEARKRQLHRDKQMLLASRSLVGMKQDNNNMYDPFNPTLSESSSSDEEAERTSLESSSQHERKPPNLQGTGGLMQGKHSKVQVKTETQEVKLSHPAYPQKTEDSKCSVDHIKVEKGSKRVDVKIEKQTVLHDNKVKKESDLDDTGESESCGDRLGNSLNSEKDYITPAVHLSLDLLQTERKFKAEERGHCAGTPNRSLLNFKDNPLPSSSASSMKKQKEVTRSESTSCPKSPLRDMGQKKNTSKALKEQPSSSSERGRDRRDHHASGQKEKDKDKERSSRRSRSRERTRRTNSTSDSSQSSSPDRSHRKRQRSRSRSKGDKRRRRSRSGSSSSSKEHTGRKKNKRRSKERSDDREERKQVSKDKRHGRSRSKSQSKSHSRSRSRSRSKDRKQGSSRSKSWSRSRSRERKKDQVRPPHVSLSSRDKVESQTKDKSRRKSRSSSREKTKDTLFKGSQKTSGSSVSCKDTKRLQDKKKERDITGSSILEPVTKVNEQDLPSSSITPKVKKEERESQPMVTKMTKEVKVGKEIKREKQTFDMFEDSPIISPIKKEETDTPSFAVSPNKDVPIKTESCEVIICKSEPSPLEVCHIPTVSSFSTMITAVTADSLHDTVSQHHLASLAPVKQQNTVSVKQEHPSDSEDDFSVDVMLDNLDYVKSELTEKTEAVVKHEKEAVKGQEETVSTLAGAKSKTQVKRVTWNIQEPEGPQPEKSASKLALYKLKLKQEGARRPSLAVQTSSQQDTTGAHADPSQKSAVGPVSSSSKLDGLHPAELSTAAQGEAEEGDLSRKDEYLKKLHMQERAIEEVKLAIKPFYQRRDVNKEEYKEILRKAVQKVCHSKSGEINPVKVGNLVKAYVDKYKHARKHKKGENTEKETE